MINIYCFYLPGSYHLLLKQCLSLSCLFPSKDIPWGDFTSKTIAMRSLGGEDSLEGKATHSSILAWRQTEEPGRGHKESDMTK